MEIIILFVINLVMLFIDFGLFKVSINIFPIVIFFLIYFLFVYKRYYLHSRKRLIIFSSLLGIFFGELQIKNVLELKKGTIEGLMWLIGLILIIIFVLEIVDLKKIKNKESGNE